MKNIYQLSVQELKKLQEQLDKRKMGVKIEGLPEAFDVAQIIKHYMVDRHKTRFVNKNGHLNRVQCTPGRRRSVEDLYVVIKTYFPGVSLQKVRDMTDHLAKRRILHHNYCGTVHKEVHSPYNLMTSAEQIRGALGPKNVKNAKYKKSLSAD